MNRMIASLIVSLVVVFFAAPRVIPFLRKLHFGQTIYELAPETHKKKQGIPTMGGLMIVVAVILCCLVFHTRNWYGFQDYMLAILVCSVLFMLVGFVDDFSKVSKKQNEGLNPKQKLIGQTAAALLWSLYCYYHPMVGSKILIPFANVQWDMGIWYVPVMTLVCVFIVNSSNLQDGLDGLLPSISSVSFAFWGMISLVMLSLVQQYDQYPQLRDSYYCLGVFCMAVCGGSMAFLRYNFYPAQVFLGDTGSMFIGGATVGMAMLTREPLMLILIAFTMIMSSVSVIMQRTYFKLTHGKRIFKMSPIHHHFELCGFSEAQIDVGYCVVTALLSLIAVLSLNGLQWFPLIP